MVFFFWQVYSFSLCIQSPSPCSIQPLPKVMEGDRRVRVERPRNFCSHLACPSSCSFLLSPSASSSPSSLCSFGLRGGSAFSLLLVYECLYTLCWFPYLCPLFGWQSFIAFFQNPICVTLLFPDWTSSDRQITAPV